MKNLNNNTANKQGSGLRSMASAFLIILLGFSSFAQPIITSFTPTSGPIGTTVTITGSNFNTTLANNIVFFGATRATVTAGSATSLTVTVPIGASYQPISVTNLTTGLSDYSAKPFVATFPCGGVINATSFAAKVDFIAGTNPTAVSIGDFDGDGKTDLAVSNWNSNTISVYRNTGSSGTISFATKVDFTTGTQPSCVSTGDFNGDGKLDLAVTNYNSNTVSVFRNSSISGIISFAAKVDFTTGSKPRSVSIGDFDGDGKTDLAVANAFGNAISVFRNTGSSSTISFATKVDFTSELDLNGISTGDFDGDGKTDLAVANNSATSVSVFRNTGSIGIISFAPKVNFTTGSGPRSVSIADFDGDGKADLAVPNFNSSTVSLFRNTGSIGTISFATKVDFTTGTTPISVSTSDLDGDSKPDLTVTNINSASVSVFRNTGNSGTISFATKVDFTTGTQPYSVSTGDFDGDGKTDLAVANNGSNAVSVFRNTIAGVPPLVTANTTAEILCAGESVTLTGGGADTYTWTGGVTNGVGFIPPSATTTYTVTGTVTATGCQNTAIITITVNPITIVTSTNNGDATITASTGDSYEWVNCATGSVIPGQTTQIFTATVNGSYAAIVTVNGCSGTSDCVVIDNFVGIKEIKVDAIQLYPNPTSDIINILTSINGAQFVSITNILGEVVLNKEVNLVKDSPFTIDISEQPEGIYFLKVGNSIEKILKH
jgi:6-phosphogluconolactonase (cycloisomerase 2 family)